MRTVAQFKVAMAERTAEHERLGLCRACSEPVVVGHKFCERHLEYHRQYRRNLRRERRAAGLCSYSKNCSRLIFKSGFCVTHYLKMGKRR